MKIRILPFVLLFLILSKMSFGAGSSGTGDFNDYINSQGTSSSSLVKGTANINHTTPAQAPRSSGQEGSQPALQGISGKWQRCSMDSDCTAGVVDCVFWEAVNKKYVKELIKNLGSCPESVDPGFQPKAVCVAQECKKTNETTRISRGEWSHANAI